MNLLILSLRLPSLDNMIISLLLRVNVKEVRISLISWFTCYYLSAGQSDRDATFVQPALLSEATCVWLGPANDNVWYHSV